MKQYTAGQLANLSGVSPRTIRYYDQRGLLPPCGHTEGGYRLYDDTSLVRMQQIIMLKFAGFSLEEIQSVLIMGQGRALRDTLEDQRQLMIQKVQQIQEIIDLLEGVEQEELTDAEQLAESMQLVRRINHSVRTYQVCEAYGNRALYPWEFDRMELNPGMRVLDVGCGCGMVWRQSWRQIPEQTELTLMDVCPWLVTDLGRFYEENKGQLKPGIAASFVRADAETDEIQGSYDRILMAYLWQHLKKPERLLDKLSAALKPDGVLHLVQGFGASMPDLDEIYHGFSGEYCLSARREAERLQLQQIEAELHRVFPMVEAVPFFNDLNFTDALPLYQYIMDSYPELMEAVKKQGVKFVSYLRRCVEEAGTVTIHGSVMLYRCGKGPAHGNESCRCVGFGGAPSDV